MNTGIIPAKYRNRMDRLAPALAFAALSKTARKRLPRLVQRLYELAEDQNPRIALDAIEKILRFSGAQVFAETGIRLAAEATKGTEDPGDEEEDDRASRRKRLARKYAEDAPAEA